MPTLIKRAQPTMIQSLLDSLPGLTYAQAALLCAAEGLVYVGSIGKFRKYHCRTFYSNRKDGDDEISIVFTHREFFSPESETNIVLEAFRNA